MLQSKGFAILHGMYRQLFLLVLLATLSMHAIAQSVNPWQGTWLGQPNLGGQQLRAVLRVSGPLDDPSVRFASPDQTDQAFPATEVELTATSLHAVFAALGLTIDLELNSENSATGTLSQRGVAFEYTPARISSNPEASIPKRGKAQDPQPPYPYQVREVSLASTDGVELAATLTRPKGNGPHPAVVLISGSGPQNRDSEISGHKPFWLIADYLTRAGYVVLRYDERGVGQSTGTYQVFDFEHFMEDASTALSYLQGLGYVDKDRIGLLGHSEGGYIAPLLASQRKGQVAFLLLLAPPVLPGIDISMSQVEALNRAMGMDEQSLEQLLAMNRVLLEAAKANDTPEGIQQAIEANLPAESLAQVKPQLPALSQQLLQQRGWLLLPDPQPVWVAAIAPTLVLFGSKDLQTVPLVNQPAAEAAIAAYSPDVRALSRVHVFDGLNHLMQPAETGLPAEYGNIATTLDEAVLAYMLAWLETLAE